MIVLIKEDCKKASSFFALKDGAIYEFNYKRSKNYS